jgi:hypothetical protein
MASSDLLEKQLLYVTQHPDRELREVKPFFSSVELKAARREREAESRLIISVRIGSPDFTMFAQICAARSCSGQ